MQGFGVAALIAGYCAWYTLFQKTWGDGTGFLFNLTGSSRFQATKTTQNSGKPGGAIPTGPPNAPNPAFPSGPPTKAAPRR